MTALGWAQTEPVEPAIPVKDLQALFRSEVDLDGKLVIFSGQVENVSYLREIRDGASVYFLRVSDGEATIRVVNSMAAVFSTGDRVRVRGVFHKADRRLGTEAEVDSNKGLLELLSGKELPGIATGGAVPVSTISTPWSRAVEIAALLSAIFGLLATPLLLKVRRFNLQLRCSEAHSNVVKIHPTGESTATLTVRLVLTNTGDLPVFLSRDMSLRRKGLSRSAERLNTPGGHEELEFPLMIEHRTSVEADFSVDSRELSKLSAGFWVVVGDAYCGKRFRFRFREPKLIAVRETAVREREPPEELAELSAPPALEAVPQVESQTTT